ncbi:hypothetical protein BC829DRAFT_489207 [Chytridium lagenaria]|nr:hypothetical protein BC829DRAFT_489207 [Chytridium lagenaria]
MAGRQSKKIVSRTWLIVINVLSCIISVIGCIIGGFAISRAGSSAEKTTSDLTKSSGVNVDTSDANEALTALFKAIGIGFIAYFAFVFLTSLCGAIGGCTRNTGVLSCYISTVLFDMVVTLGICIYGLVVLIKEMKNWESYSLQNWNSQTDAYKDYYQNTFSCCGIDSNNSGAYRETFSLFGGGRNLCSAVPLVNVQSCQIGGRDFYYRIALYGGIGGGVILAILAISVGAAYHARKSERSLQTAASTPSVVNVINTDNTAPTPYAKDSYTQDPYMQQNYSQQQYSPQQPQTYSQQQYSPQQQQTYNAQQQYSPQQQQTYSQYSPQQQQYDQQPYSASYTPPVQDSGYKIAYHAEAVQQTQPVVNQGYYNGQVITPPPRRS